MSDKVTVPIEEALKCPECQHSGMILFSNGIVGGTLHKVQCRNEVCPWYRTNWFIETDHNGEVQVNEDAMKKANAKRLIAPHDPEFDKHHEAIGAMLDRQIGEEVSGN